MLLVIVVHLILRESAETNDARHVRVVCALMKSCIVIKMGELEAPTREKRAVILE